LLRVSLFAGGGAWSSVISISVIRADASLIHASSVTSIFVAAIIAAQAPSASIQIAGTHAKVSGYSGAT
jgi:hypothetical protein